MNSRPLTIALGLSLVIPAWTGLFSAGVPTIYCPLPTLTIVPGFLLSRWHAEWLAVMLPTLLFFAWNPGLVVRPRAQLPKRTVAALGVLTVLTVVDFVFEWRYGVKYQGIRYTELIYISNAIWLVVLWFTFIRCMRQASFNINLLAHFLLFMWLGWYAFPYLGELP